MEVLVVVLLFGGFIVTLHGNVELVGGTGVIVFQDFVQEEIPDLERERENERRWREDTKTR